MRRLRELGVLAVAVALWGCDAGVPTAPAAPGVQESDGPLVALKRTPVVEGSVATPLWFGRLGRTAVSWVGPAGGTLEVAGVRLTIPAGALWRPRLIAMRVPRSEVVQVTLLPHGLRFARSAELSFGLEGTEAEGDPELAASLVGVYFLVPIKDDTVIPNEIVPTRVVPGHVVLTIDHFSGYTPAGG